MPPGGRQRTRGVWQLREDIQEILFDEKTLAARVAQLGSEITRDYQGKNLLLVCILKGSLVFMADLMRHIQIPASIDFMSVSSYGSGVNSSGEVKIIKDLDRPVQGADLLIVEDILDSGQTLFHLCRMLRRRGPASLRIAVLLDKPERRQVEIRPDYTGFEVPDRFLVGYGLDYDEKYRNLPFVGILKPEVYTR